MKPYRSVDMHIRGGAAYELIAAPSGYLIIATGLASGVSTAAWSGPSARVAGVRWAEACGGECMVSMSDIVAAGTEARDG